MRLFVIENDKKVKVKVSLSMPVRHIGKQRYIAQRILNVGCRYRYVVSRTPRPPYLRKEPWCQLNRELGGTHSQSRRLGEEKNALPLPGFDLRIVQPVTK
jgi:hypothetical protein